MPVFTTKVTGSATIPHLAERAWVGLSVADEGSDRQLVTENVLKTARQIEEKVQALQASKSFDIVDIESGENNETLPIAHYSKTSISVTSSMQHMSMVRDNQDKAKTVQKRIFHVEIDFDIRFRDFAALGEFTAQLAAIDHCEVSGIDWKLLPATQKSYESRLRKDAIQDSLNKVKDYCSVLYAGREVTINPIWLDQTGYTSLYAGRGRKKYIPPAASVGHDAMSFRPEECTMSLRIDVTYEIDTEGVKTQL